MAVHKASVFYLVVIVLVSIVHSVTGNHFEKGSTNEHPTLNYEGLLKENKDRIVRSYKDISWPRKQIVYHARQATPVYFICRYVSRGYWRVCRSDAVFSKPQDIFPSTCRLLKVESKYHPYEVTGCQYIGDGFWEFFNGRNSGNIHCSFVNENGNSEGQNIWKTNYRNLMTTDPFYRNENTLINVKPKNILNPTLRTGLSAHFDPISWLYDTVLRPSVEMVQNATTEMIASNIVDSFKAVVLSVVSPLGNPDDIIKLLSSIIDASKKMWNILLKAAKEGILDIREIRNVISRVLDSIGRFKGSLQNSWNSIKDTLKKYLTVILESSPSLKPAVDIVSLVLILLDKVIETTTSISIVISESTSDSFLDDNEALKVVRGIISSAVQFLEPVVNEIHNILNYIRGATEEALSTIADNVPFLKPFINIVQTVLNSVENILEASCNLSQNILNSLKTDSLNVTETLKQVQSFISSLLKSLESYLSGLQKLWSDIKARLEKALNTMSEGSPSLKPVIDIVLLVLNSTEKAILGVSNKVLK